MPLIVQKFGGTSVANTTRIKEIIPLIKFEKDLGNDVIIVVSAMAGVTNQLITLCNEVSSLLTQEQLAEYDAALSSGEMVTASLVSLKLQEENIMARSVFSWQLPLITNYDHTKALVESFSVDLLTKCLKLGIIPVIAGFQGITPDNKLTTLGRGGSDTTATLVAARMKADRCDIYTDVEGVFTADPRIVHQAKKLTVISFEEMLEFASSGAKVLNARSIEVASRYNVPLRVLSSFTQDNGTLIISKDKIMENRIITGITSNKNLLKVSIENAQLSFSNICSLVSDNNIHVELMLNMDDNKKCSFITHLADKNRLEILLNNLKSTNNIADYIIDTKIAIISLIGYGIKNDYGLIKIILTHLEKENITVNMVQISEIKVSLLIRDNNTEKAIHSLHDLFELDK